MRLYEDLKDICAGLKARPFPPEYYSDNDVREISLAARRILALRSQHDPRETNPAKFYGTLCAAAASETPLNPLRARTAQGLGAAEPVLLRIAVDLGLDVKVLRFLQVYRDDTNGRYRTPYGA